ncbi:chorismate mutase [Ferrithrix thermotolerans DSM 19514]|jgi:chorismate mutase|uniref:chorismate mutase n=1 Tax=Ferrithrix thermotolerans DSM 19514 TaxID=1121881 RepID=A0A1M4W3D1_9ACTN|nr:chorismate mutase [Ferrithrix thermotolerans]SHE75665.1 chorismate mutase [Ferrithrix thermotolerans DSM 19514]
MPVRGLRGATTVLEDTISEVTSKTKELVSKMLEVNGIDKEQLISIIFTATNDVHSMFPATAARELGLGDVPLMCARELDIVGATPLCLRVLMHLETDRGRRELHHVYLHGAKNLRDDLPE